MNLRIIVILLLLSACAFYSQAQPYVSNMGRFEVDQKKGCVPLTVNVTIRPPFVCNGATPCDMDYENNGGFVKTASLIPTHSPEHIHYVFYFKHRDLIRSQSWSLRMCSLPSKYIPVAAMGHK